ncbi:interleukin-12 subunit alpha isoform X2 [Hemicordylus capensis]|uniref:interleukin-12 subunit alpha isoform X2 n=1 Tax=Hemicordylus capensis TaxID=884348 RepID=UPI002302BB07|nr:interleukin-12 subunit alpha isoform X2 [Hemicordylus capensis]
MHEPALPDLQEWPGIDINPEETINCTMEQILPSNPNNEKNIIKACIEGKSKSGFCLSVENDTVDEAQCMETIYRILKRYEVKIKDFNSPKLLGTVNLMMKDLKTSHKITEQQSSTTQHPFERNFQKERDQCEILLILQQLAQTINRILSYRQSLEI